MKKGYLLMIVSILFISLNLKAQEKGTFTDKRDGKIYKTIKIGTQIWMAENLAFKTDGCSIPDNDPKNLKTYGYLYEWETAKRVCPSGWHLPNKDEWSTLVNFLGGEKVAGVKLKSTDKWINPIENATNSSGFNALPGGRNGYCGPMLGYGGGWWSSTEYYYQESAYLLSMYNKVVGAIITADSKTCGVSIRCVKD
jgi:uncharacterized protein (TIGR02145 family)